MPFNPQEHHRRSIRRPGYDYAAAGAYFVTICAHNRSCLFGDVIDGEMRLNDAGRMVAESWRTLPDRFPGVELDAFILMPNHLHGVIVFNRREADPSRGEPRVRPPALPPDEPALPRPHGTAPASLGRVLQAFKSVTTTRYIEGVSGQSWRRFSGHLWQRDFFDHVIRTDRSFEAICWYIETNPDRWDEDVENLAGRGGDDVRAWVRELETEPKPEAWHAVTPGATFSARGAEGEHAVRPYGARDDQAPRASSAAGGEGEHEVRPYGAGGGRTRGSPLRTRIGHGYDLHRLEAGPRLVLGGVAVSEDVRPVAHSDGDVVLHALVDALLGAMGWGDIGEQFPNTDPRWKDVPSRVFVETVYAKVAAARYGIGNVDITILAEKPKLKPFKSAMVEFIAQLLQVPPDRVNVKAGTNEGCDAIGRGEAIAAHAVVLLQGDF